jgi:hypothetical protein
VAPPPSNRTFFVDLSIERFFVVKSFGGLPLFEQSYNDSEFTRSKISVGGMEVRESIGPSYIANFGTRVIVAKTRDHHIV